MSSKRAYSEFRKCSICSAKVKIGNLEKHYRNVHPNYVNELAIRRLDNKTCPICGKDTQNGICKEHFVKILPKFFVKEIFLPLKEDTNRILRLQKASSLNYILLGTPMKIYGLFGNAPEKGTPESFTFFSNETVFLGYSLVRLSEAFSDIGDIAYNMAIAESGSSIERTRYDSPFLEALLSEFEFFQAVLFGVNGLYDVAVDSETKPSILFIVPRTDTEAVRKMILYRIHDAEATWRTSLVRIVHPFSEESVVDQRGATFYFPKKEIENRFESFNNIWSKYFSQGLSSKEEYFALCDFLKWIVAPLGFTRNNQSRVKYLDDFPNFNLKEDRLFSILDCLLMNIKAEFDIVSPRSLSKMDLYLEVNGKLMRLGYGYRFSSSQGQSYFLPTREWFYNKSLPVLVEFGRSLDVAGEFFEEYMVNILNLASKGRLKLKFTTDFGLIPVLSIKDSPNKLVFNWKKLEKDFKIMIDEAISELIGKKGDIDLIIYANFNLYLLELKSLNLTKTKGEKYLREKAPIQCAKYAAWARKRENIDNILKKHGILSEDVQNVRILCCSNGIFEDIVITCKETNEQFAVVPQFILLGLLIGALTVSIRDIFPEGIAHIKNGIQRIQPNMKMIGLIDIRQKLNESANTILANWLNLMIFDRRRDFSKIKFTEKKTFEFAKFETFREMYIGGTCKWILKEPFFVKEENGWKYFVGTQIASAGETLVCNKCKAAVKYYLPEMEENYNRVQQILTQRRCSFCKEHIESSTEDSNIRGTMTRIMAAHKYELDQIILDDSNQDTI